MEEYRAKRDCYFNGLYLKKGQVVKLSKEVVGDFKLLELVNKGVPEAPKAKPTK
jgi:hypothetical protein